MILQTNKFFIFRYLLYFTAYWRQNVLEVTLYTVKKPETMQKLCLSTNFPYQEIRWNYGIFCRGIGGQIKASSFLFWWEKYKKWTVLQSDCETLNKELTDKKKTNLFCKFCKSVSIPREQVQDCSKEFPGNSSKRYPGKPNGHHDHCMINMSGQRLETGGNWRLNSPYLQCCLHYVLSTSWDQIPISLCSSSWTNKGR